MRSKKIRKLLQLSVLEFCIGLEFVVYGTTSNAYLATGKALEFAGIFYMLYYGVKLFFPALDDSIKLIDDGDKLKNHEKRLEVLEKKNE